MEKRIRLMTILQSALLVLLIASYGYFIICEAIMPERQESVSAECGPYDGEWQRVLLDGGTEKVEVPGECQAEWNEVVTIETKLPSTQEDTWFCIRALQQDVEIYVDGQLRKEYSTLDTQLFGKTSTIAYVFFPVYETDANKTLSIDLVSDSSYAGVLGDIYTGAKEEIWKYLFTENGPNAVASLFMFFLGLLVVVISLAMQIGYKREVDLLYLGMAVVLASTWLLAESKLRQFILPNATVAMHMGFFMTMLLPFASFSYMNQIQKKRYEKPYTVAAVITFTNFVVVTVLQVLKIKDFCETMLSSHLVIVLVVLMIFVTIFMDMKKGYIKDYKGAAIGFAGLMVAGIWEVYLAQQNYFRYNGIGLVIGTIFMLFMAALKTVKEIINTEKEKQVAIEANASQARFIANMSHEIRTPINTIIGMNEMILRESENESIHEYANNVKHASQMLLGLVNDILDFSKIEAGKLKIVESEYNTARVLYDIVLGSEVRAKQKGLEFKLDIDESIPSMLKGDELRIKQILNNLLSNAIKYTESGSVTLAARGLAKEDGFVLELSVIDTGMGIKEEDLSHLFESFTRLELDKNRYIEGTGLGLNITKQLTDLMQGKMQVTSTCGEGSCFKVSIPQVIIDESPMGSIEQSRNKVNSKENQQILYAPDSKILIVDDNEMNLAVMEALLKRTCIQVDFATGGNEALSLCREKEFDLILMDHMMPKPDGIETLHLLREDGQSKNQKTEVIVLTANATAGIEKMYLEEGFAGYLSKPVEARELESTLAKCLGIDTTMVEVEKEESQKENEKKTSGKIILDKEDALKRMAGKTQLYEKALQLYVKQAESYVEDLEKMFKGKDWENYSIITHAIKSTSMTIGAKAFSQKAKLQEMASKDKDEEFLAREWEGFIKSYKELIAYIKENN